MDLLIYSLLDAIEHLPKKSTYAIRIYTSGELGYGTIPLTESSLYFHIKEYVFDDIEPWSQRKGILLQEDLATLILSEFRDQGLSCESLLVHCAQGKNRSPAVAIALNEIFRLGHDTKKLQKRYPAYNQHVYKMLLETGKKNGL